MPRVIGVSGRSRTRPILFSPSPIRVSRWACWRRCGPPVCMTLIVLPVAMVCLPLLGGLGLAAFAAARLQGGDLDVAPRRDRTRRIDALERVERGTDHVVGIRRTDRFRHHVLHAERLEYGAHRATGDDAGAGRSGAQEYLAGAVTAAHVMMQGAALAQRYARHVAPRGVGRLADRFGHLARLAVAEADPA